VAACGGSTDGAQTWRQLYAGLGVSVLDFHCRAHVEPLGKEEPNPTHSIVFVRRGMFALNDAQDTFVADPTHILFFNQGQPYRYAHPLPGGDECTILAIDSECARRAVETLSDSRRRDRHNPFPYGAAPLTRRAARLHYELLLMLSDGRALPELSIQDALMELLSEAIRALRHVTATRSRQLSSKATLRNRDIVEAVKVLLGRSLDRPPSLTDLAAAMQCSPFHLSRIFRSVTGVALRDYVRRLRTLLAADQLRRGAADLTSLALGLGFYDHSHFTHAFRREWGVPPSHLRETAARIRSAIAPPT
jgi:AraC-like DNA-binding protein